MGRGGGGDDLVRERNRRAREGSREQGRVR